jgi:DNA-binding protein HU-beta
VSAMRLPGEFGIDAETDDLLQRIAESGDEITPALLREIIPSREEFVRYLQEHDLTEYPIAQSILAQYDAISEPLQTSGLKSVLARAMADRLKLSPETTAALIDLLVETAISEIKQHGEFLIPGVGRLIRVERPARLGRNPRTGESIEIAPQSTVKFRAIKATKEGIDAGEEAGSGLEAGS